MDKCELVGAGGGGEEYQYRGDPGVMEYWGPFRIFLKLGRKNASFEGNSIFMLDRTTSVACNNLPNVVGL